jgi:hypothetical protein
MWFPVRWSVRQRRSHALLQPRKTRCVVAIDPIRRETDDDVSHIVRLEGDTRHVVDCLPSHGSPHLLVETVKAKDC